MAGCSMPGRMMAALDPLVTTLIVSAGFRPSWDRFAGHRLPLLETLPGQESAPPAPRPQPAAPATRPLLRP